MKFYLCTCYYIILHYVFNKIPKLNGGESGIRTHGTLASTPHFECGAFDQLSHLSFFLTHLIIFLGENTFLIYRNTLAPKSQPSR